MLSKEPNIIIDTDPGTDDAIAIAAACAFFRNNIKAMISSYGNTDGVQTYYNLIKLAEFLQLDCTLFKGAINPLSGNSSDFTDFTNFTDYHGENGLCGLEIENTAGVHSREFSNNLDNPDNFDNFDNMYELIKKQRNIKYIAIGPLTNFAVMCGKFPEFANYISELIIMGGGFAVSNVKHGAEYNFSMDAEAVIKVLELPVKKIIAPLDMTHELAFSLSEIEDIVGISREKSKKMIYDNTFAVFAELFYLNYETSVKHGNSGAIIHDAATLAYLLDKNKCILQEYKIRADKYGALKKDSKGEPVFIIEKIDRELVKNMLKETFEKIKIMSKLIKD